MFVGKQIMAELIPTPHNNCADASLIAKTVLLPGDPLRAKFIADTFLTDVIQFNNVRGMNGYTGKYNGKRISVMGSGMGQPSLGIYTYELFNFYGVENIVRIGSAGAYSPDLKVFDTVLVTDAYSESTFAKVAYDMGSHIMKSDKTLNKKLHKAAEELGIPLTDIRAHSSDVFYHPNPKFSWEKIRDEKGCSAVEMESFALFATAKASHKRATCLLTISDSFINPASNTTAEQRQNSFTNMMKIALSLASNRK
jgi:purine-nucleoside phosphorylase